jgi:hypothetical protein
VWNMGSIDVNKIGWIIITTTTITPGVQVVLRTPLVGINHHQPLCLSS